MNRADQHLHTISRKALDAVTQAQPAAWRRRLDAARGQALATHAVWGRPWQVAAVAAALVAALAVGIVLRPDTTAPTVPVADADLYQDLEFYLWLAQELESESPSRS